MNQQTTLFGVPAVHRREIRPANGYAAESGTGPNGETCGSCRHFIRRRGGKYFKCFLIVGNNDTGTHGAGTDIRKGAAACQFWEKRAE